MLLILEEILANSGCSLPVKSNSASPLFLRIRFLFHFYQDSFSSRGKNHFLLGVQPHSTRFLEEMGIGGAHLLTAESRYGILSTFTELENLFQRFHILCKCIPSLVGD